MARIESAWLDDGLALFFGGTPTEAEAAEWDFRSFPPDSEAASAARAPALRLVHQRELEWMPPEGPVWHQASEDLPRRAACG